MKPNYLYSFVLISIMTSPLLLALDEDNMDLSPDSTIAAEEEEGDEDESEGDEGDPESIDEQVREF